MITVVNKYKEPNHIYCARGSALGNPYGTKKGTLAQFVVSSREEAISSFKTYFHKKTADKDPTIMAALQHIKNVEARDGNVNIGCFCKPKACHLDVVKEYLDGSN